MILFRLQARNVALRVLVLSLRWPSDDILVAPGLQIRLAETICETPCYRGICYRAANWIHLGRTQGRGKLDTRRKHN